MLVVIDNFDSFTYNLVHFLGELGAECAVYRNNAISTQDVAAMAAETGMPLLGVCLGHQSIGQHFGGRIVRAAEIKHGKTSPIHHDDTGLFEGLPNPMVATRYHSLIIDPETTPAELRVTARTEDGVIMGVQHQSLPIHGVQFHPESIATESGHALLKNFLDRTGPPARRQAA